MRMGDCAWRGVVSAGDRVIAFANGSSLSRGPVYLNEDGIPRRPIACRRAPRSEHASRDGRAAGKRTLEISAALPPYASCYSGPRTVPPVRSRFIS